MLSRIFGLCILVTGIAAFVTRMERINPSPSSIELLGLIVLGTAIGITIIMGFVLATGAMIKITERSD